MSIKKIVVFVVLLIGTVITSLFANINVNALGEGYDYDKYAKKAVLGSYIYTKFDGTIETTYYVFGPDLIVWEGLSRSYWVGSSPYYADSITHVDKIVVTGGTTSFSVGSSGAGITVSTSSNSASIAYTVENQRSIYINYSYSAYDGFPLTVDQYCSGTFKFGNTFYVVDSEANQYYFYSSHYWI